MILMSLDMIREGMVNARPIFTSQGLMLLDEDVVIKERYLNRLKELGIRSIYIRDDLGDGKIVRDMVRKELKISSFIVIENIMNNLCYLDENEFDNIKKIINKIIEDLLTPEDILVNLSEIRAIDDYTFGHCVNVSVLSLVTAISLGYDKEKLIDLGAGAILHDIGKARIEFNILNKPSSLTMSEYEIVKRHTTYGYAILNNIKNISFDSKIIALSHHERYDGNGYPHNIKGEDIHEYARIVSIADVYDALTNDRVYKKKASIDEALDYILSMSGSQFDGNIVNKFVDNIARYPVGKGIVLNTGFKGYVISNKKGYTSRPVVRILYNNLGKRVKVPYILDLSEIEDSINIVETTDDIELF
ncbi:HD-GYP domain-containing protein [Proteiniborus sp.]|uniref:HD-GYP domain-containing protein n=1 Tax=Proteiniborus sp. TaxID=2079015 RepID=UPI00332EA30F